jgi:ATP/ADP translocase
MSSSSGHDTGIGFFGLLTIVFIVLKLTGYIDWSWFWVLSPILIPIIIFIGGALIFAILFIKEGFKK